MADKRFTLVSPDGTVGTVDADKVQQAYASGYRPETDEEYQARKNRELFGGRTVAAAALAAARGATFGVSDAAIKALSAVPEERAAELQQIKTQNPEASAVGEAAGIVGSSFVPGSPVARAAKVGSAAERTVASVLAKRGAGKIVSSGVGKGVGSAIEGAIYGGAQAIDEATLGDPTINAEKVVASMGLGALFAGATGGLLGAAGGAAKSAVAKVGKEDAREAAAQWLSDFAGDQRFSAAFGQNKRAFVQINQKRLAQQADEAVKEAIEGGARSQAEITESLLAKREELRNLNAKMVDDLDTAVARMEAKAGRGALPDPNNPSPMPGIVDPKEVARRIREEMIKPIADSPAQRDIVDYLRKEADAIEAFGGSGRRLTFAEASAERRAMQAKINYNVIGGDPKPLLEAKAGIARTWNDVIDSEADKITEAAGIGKEAYRDLRRKLGVYEEISKHAESRALGNQSVRSISPSDYIAGVGGFVGGAVSSPMTSLVTGPAMAVANKLGRTYLPSYLSRGADWAASILRADRTIRSADSRLARAAIGLVSESTRKIPVLSSRVALDWQKESAELEKVMDAEEATARVDRYASPYDDGAPQLATAVRVQASKAAAFLASKLPRPSLRGLQPQLQAKKWKPSAMDAARYQRYKAAVNDPIGVLESARAGVVSREQVETMRAVYPAMYNEFVSQVIASVGDRKDAITHATRIRLGLLLGTETDQSLSPRYLRAMDAARSPQAEQQENAAKENRPRLLAKFDIAKPQITGAQKRST